MLKRNMNNFREKKTLTKWKIFRMISFIFKTSSDEIDVYVDATTHVHTREGTLRILNLIISQNVLNMLIFFVYAFITFLIKYSTL